MPCSTDGWGDDDVKQIRLLTERLCGLAARVEAAGRPELINADPVLAEWWRTHKQLDQVRRKTAERKRAELAEQAAAKLTPDEREALGIR